MCSGCELVDSVNGEEKEGRIRSRERTSTNSEIAFIVLRNALLSPDTAGPGPQSYCLGEQWAFSWIVQPKRKRS